MGLAGRCPNAQSYPLSPNNVSTSPSPLLLLGKENTTRKRLSDSASEESKWVKSYGSRHLNTKVYDTSAKSSMHARLRKQIKFIFLKLNPCTILSFSHLKWNLRATRVISRLYYIFRIGCQLSGDVFRSLKSDASRSDAGFNINYRKQCIKHGIESRNDAKITSLLAL